MKINTVPESYTNKLVSIIEKKYNAKYILETSIHGANQPWAEYPSLIFYTKTPHPEGSNYFAITRIIKGFSDPDNPVYDIVISNAIKMLDVIFTGVLNEDTDTIEYSRYRHDHRSCGDGNYIDGGRDYIRNSENTKLVNFKIDKDSLKILI